MSTINENFLGCEAEVIPPHLALKAMRDSGYKNTAYALAELIDNSVQAGADSVEVFCVEKKTKVSERERKRITQIGVLDNGTGMDAGTLRQALQFGNGTHLDDRSGIGRFGMGLPNASISQCRKLEVWSWQSGPDNALYTYLDLDLIESGDTRVVPNPQEMPLPKEWRTHAKVLESHGTLVVWSNFDDHRLSWKTSTSALHHTEILLGRLYRKFIHKSLIEIRLVSLEEDKVMIDRFAQVNDPLYLMHPSSTPAPFNNKPMFQKWGESDRVFPIEYKGKTHEVIVRMSWATLDTIPENPTPDRGTFPYGKHAAKNVGISIVRAGRELTLDDSWTIRDPRERWWGIEVEFPPELDEVFGVTNNKQDATHFSGMSQFEWEKEAEADEDRYMDFKERWAEEGNPRVHLIDIAEYIREQLSQIRNRVTAQTEGRRKSGQRHNTSVEDTASTAWKERAKKGYTTKSDKETFDEEARDKLFDDLVKTKHYPPKDAREIVDAVSHRGRKIIFVTAESDAQAFFQVDPKAGGITEIVFNTRHPAYAKLFKALDSDVSQSSPSELVERIENAANTLKLLLAAWARYEEEDYPSRDQIYEIRQEWGKMAKNFIPKEES